MPITFDSIQDPFGLGKAGSTLGSLMMQRSQEELQNQRQLELENRAEQRGFNKENRLLNRQNSALGSAIDLLDDDLSLSSQRAFLKKYAENQGNLEDGINVLKQLTNEKIAGFKSSGKGAPKSAIEKKLDTAAADYVINTREKADQADQFIRDVPELEKAINSPELEDQWALTRFFKGQAQKLPGGQAVLNPQEQTISTFSKRMVTDLTDMKGLRLTDAKLRWLQNAVVEVGKTPESNARALEIAKDLYKINSMQRTLMEEIIQENDGEVPSNIQTLVGQRLNETLNNYIESQPDFKNSNSSSQTFDSLPTAKEYKGKMMRDRESGEVYKSDGTRWTKVQ